MFLFLFIPTCHLLQGITKMCYKFPSVVSLAVPLPMHQILNLPMMPALCNDVLDTVYVFATSGICNVLGCPKLAILFAMRG